MNTPVIRTVFAEGRILSAADLETLSQIPRGRSERHNRFVHRWGIVTGLTLTAEPSEDANGTVFANVFLEPGLAIDGEGREILVTDRVQLNARRFQLEVGNSIDPTLSYPVFLSSQYRGMTEATGPTDPCGGGTGGARIEEGFAVSFGDPGDETLPQEPPPLSGAPSEPEGSSDWQILLGFVTWTNDAGNFAGIDTDAAARHRPFIGINAGIVAGDGNRVQVQPRDALLPGDTVLQVNQTADGPELCFGTFKSRTAAIETLLKVDAKGNLTVEGELTGKRSGTTVQMQSGIASHGIILPLPPGITEAQIADGSVTLHLQVAPMVDPAHSPDPSGDFAALVQECRVDEDRRVHCRIAWASLPLGGGVGAVGDTIEVGPGAVRFTVAVATGGEPGA
jgi:hypothetical protein